jgi:hypothetical protein
LTVRKVKVFKMKKLLAVVISAALFFVASCAKDSTSPKSEDSTSPKSEPGKITIGVTDAPGEYESVNITFDEVKVHKASDSDTTGNSASWIIVKTGAQTIDLLKFANGEVSPFSSTELDTGKYTQVRLKITDANVIYKGKSYNLNIPSGAQTGLKLNHPFEIKAGSTYELIIDFDVNKSIKPIGRRGNFTGFIMKPTIRLIAKATSGSISGTVNDASRLPVAYAISGSDTVTSTPVNITTKAFKLAFLPPGTYTVAVVDTSLKKGSKSGVSVEAGKDNAIGEITLN